MSQHVLTVTVLGFGSGHEKKLMTCPWGKHWVCGWVDNLTQVCSKLSYSFKNWGLFCIKGGAGVRFAYHPDHFSTQLALLITCPPSLIEYLLNIWPLLTYSNSLRWLSQGVQSSAIYSGRIIFIQVTLSLEQGQQFLPRLNHGLWDKAQIFSILAIRCFKSTWRVLLSVRMRSESRKNIKILFL